MSNLVKYPRTPHIPISLGISEDDIRIFNYNNFLSDDIVVTEKYDGENTTMYSDNIHARSLDSKHHSSRSWIKQFHSEIAYKIPEGWRLCGENLYATHSIHYKNLKSYFLLFSVWDENNICLSWDDTLLIAKEMGLEVVREMYRGPFTANLMLTLASSFDYEKQEGFVVRTTRAFHYDSFSNNVAKFVRPHHVNTDEHWMQKEVIPNEVG